MEDASGKAFLHLLRLLEKEQGSASRIEHLELVGSPRYNTLLSIRDLNAMLGACLRTSRDPATPHAQCLKRVTLRGVFLVDTGERITNGMVLGALRLELVAEASPGAMTRLLGMFSRIVILYVDCAREISLPDEEGLAALGPLGIESLRITKTESDTVMEDMFTLLRMRGDFTKLARLQVQCRSVEELLSVFDVMHRSAQTLVHLSLNLVDVWNLGIPDIREWYREHRRFVD